MIEIWKDIQGYEGLYQVSNFGNVISLNFRNKKEKYKIAQRILNNGYFSVTIHKNGKKQTIEVHRLVAIAFLPNPFNLPCVNHINENKLDNRAENLEWCTWSYNNKYGKGNKKRTESKKNTWKKKKNVAA